nr:hypothetical protein [Tanacetum cinerariifolium]
FDSDINSIDFLPPYSHVYSARLSSSVFQIAIGCDRRIWSKLLVEGQAEMLK